MTLVEIRKTAARRPGLCAVCGRKLRVMASGRPGILCSARVRKSCRKAYQAAYRAATRRPRLRLIVDVKPHPKTGLRRVKLECGHVRELPAGELNSGRQRSHCQNARCVARLNDGKRAA